MTASSVGNDGKGGKQPVKKAGKLGSHIKVGSDKTCVAESKKDIKKVAPGIDQVFRKMGEEIDRKKEAAGGAGDQARDVSRTQGKDSPGQVLQMIVNSREKEIMEIEKKLTETHDSRERSVLAVQLKGAQYALKEALVNMSLTHKKTEASLNVAWSEDGDEVMKCEDNQNKQEGKRSDHTDADNRNNEMEMMIQDEGEFYADNKEESSDEDLEIADDTMNTQENKTQKRNRDNEVVDLTGTNENEASWKATKANGEPNAQDIPWGDISDDETVIQTNSEQDNEHGWQIATSKKSKKSQTRNKINQSQENKTKEQSTDQKSNTNQKIANPYKASQGLKKTTGNTQAVQSSLASYAAAATETQRSPNTNSISVTTSFTPRLSGAGEYKRVAKELLAYAKEIAPEVMMLPWNDHSGLGPIKEEDLANPKNYTDTIRHYFDKPSYVTMQPGTPAYGIGVRFSVNCNKYEFLNKWNIKKREYKVNNRAAYTITLAPMQASPTAFIIGLAVGSTENQDVELLNERLQKATGIKGIEVSYQNIHQSGITPEFWKLANSKAAKSNADKMSKEYLRTKYLWAPNGLAVYVPKREMVSVARKIMQRLYGKTISGRDPVWPDGSSMRFLPIKGAAIKSDKTKEVIHKRLAYHIWLKANELSIATNMVNIHETIEVLEGKTFSEIILETTSRNDTTTRIFNHFKRAWNMDPSKESWDISVKNQFADEAIQYVHNVRDKLFDKYGPEIDYFFSREGGSKEWVEAVNSNKQTQDDDDDWFDDEDDNDELVKKGLIDPAFVQFLSGKEVDIDRQSVASWGTGDTAYTEIFDNQDSSGTVNSSITQESSLEVLQDIEKKKEIVNNKLKELGITNDNITKIANNESPYELVFSGIQLESWKPDKEIFYIMALFESNNTPDKTNDDDDDL
jgi:hypothetical protein